MYNISSVRSQRLSKRCWTAYETVFVPETVDSQINTSYQAKVCLHGLRRPQNLVSRESWMRVLNTMITYEHETVVRRVRRDFLDFWSTFYSVPYVGFVRRPDTRIVIKFTLPGTALPLRYHTQPRKWPFSLLWDYWRGSESVDLTLPLRLLRPGHCSRQLWSGFLFRSAVAKVSRQIENPNAQSTVFNNENPSSPVVELQDATEDLRFTPLEFMLAILEVEANTVDEMTSSARLRNLCLSAVAKVLPRSRRILFLRNPHSKDGGLMGAIMLIVHYIFPFERKSQSKSCRTSLWTRLGG